MPSNALFIGPLDRVLSLKTLPVLEALSSRELVAIAQKMRERFIPRGARLIRPGETLTASYLVVDGRLEIASPDAVRPAESGDSVGFLELLARQPFPGEARATLDTLVLELDADDQEDIWEDDFAIMFQYLRHLSVETIAELREPGSVTIPATFGSPAVVSERPLNLVERILTLHRIPMLSSESIDALAELSGHFREIRHEPGDQLWRRGDDPAHFWIVISGRARARSPGSAGESDVGPGVCLGLEEAVANVGYSNHCWAERALSTLQIDREPFVDVLEDHFPMARHLLMMLAKRLLDLRTRDARRAL